MALHCPFCFSEEEERIEARNAGDEEIVLVSFNCPFYFQFHKSEYMSDSESQTHLDNWREKEGEFWLDSLGPVMRAREIRNMERRNATKNP